MLAKKVSYELAYSLLDSCTSSNSMIRVTPCKKALGSVLQLLHFDNGPLMRRLLNSRSRIKDEEYTEIKRYLVVAFKREFGVDRDMLVVGKSKSRIGMNYVLSSLVHLVECTRERCNDKRSMRCISTACPELLIVCLELASDLYTKYPCLPAYKVECVSGMKKFASDTVVLVSKLHGLDRLSVDDLSEIEMRLRFLWTVSFVR